MYNRRELLGAAAGLIAIPAAAQQPVVCITTNNGRNLRYHDPVLDMDHFFQLTPTTLEPLVRTPSQFSYFHSDRKGGLLFAQQRYITPDAQSGSLRFKYYGPGARLSNAESEAMVKRYNSIAACPEIRQIPQSGKVLRFSYIQGNDRGRIAYLNKTMAIISRQPHNGGTRESIELMLDVDNEPTPEISFVYQVQTDSTGRPTHVGTYTETPRSGESASVQTTRFNEIGKASTFTLESRNHAVESIVVKFPKPAIEIWGATLPAGLELQTIIPDEKMVDVRLLPGNLQLA